MNAVGDVPESLVQRMKVWSSRPGTRAGTPAGRVVELAQRWLSGEPLMAEDEAAIGRLVELERVWQMCDEVMKDAPPGPTLREILEEDRNRLERPGYGWPLDEDGKPILSS